MALISVNTSSPWVKFLGLATLLLFLFGVFSTPASSPRKYLSKAGLLGGSGASASSASSASSSERKVDANGYVGDEDVADYCAQRRWKPFSGDRSRRRKVFDLFMISNELDWLEIRMGEMESQVDFFVITESAVTFTGKEKPLYVRENWDRYRRYHHKMILHTMDWTGQESTDAWAREEFSRNAMFNQVFPGLNGEQTPLAGDVILVSDVDEMVRPEVLQALRNCDFPRHVRLFTKIYYYSFQWVSPGEGPGKGDWGHPDATYFEGSFSATTKPHALRFGQPEATVWNAGWHCSFCLPLLDDIVTKIQSFSHTEMDRPENTDRHNILQRVRQGLDVFGRGGSDCERVDNNPDVPRFLLNNRGRFAFALDRDPPSANFIDYTGTEQNT